nr:hypothetical protein [Actinokineospora globicatena]
MPGGDGLVLVYQGDDEVGVLAVAHPGSDAGVEVGYRFADCVFGGGGAECVGEAFYFAAEAEGFGEEGFGFEAFAAEVGGEPGLGVVEVGEGFARAGEVVEVAAVGGFGDLGLDPRLRADAGGFAPGHVRGRARALSMRASVAPR